MKTNGAAILALVILIPAASCADAETDSTTTAETSGEAASSDGANVYSVGDLRLDCPQGFEHLQAEAIAMDGMEMVTETDEQIAYMAGPVSFTLTKDTHYAHPMIIRRDIIVGEEDKLSVNMAACGYGSKEESDKVMERFALLNERFLLQQKIQIQSDAGSGFEITEEDMEVGDEE